MFYTCICSQYSCDVCLIPPDVYSISSDVYSIICNVYYSRIIYYICSKFPSFSQMNWYIIFPEDHWIKLHFGLIFHQLFKTKKKLRKNHYAFTCGKSRILKQTFLNILIKNLKRKDSFDLNNATILVFVLSFIQVSTNISILQSVK